MVYVTCGDDGNSSGGCGFVDIVGITGAIPISECYYHLLLRFPSEGTALDLAADCTIKRDCIGLVG